MTKPTSTPILAAISTFPVIVAFFVFAAPAAALPITYSIEGTGSGSLDGTPFTGALVNITATGDTSNISIFSTFSQNPISPVTVSAYGVTDTLPDTAAFVDRSSIFLDAGFSIFASPTSLSPFWSTANSVFASYFLDTSIGPVSGPPFFGFVAIPTGSGGSFSLTDMGTSTFEATVVPLPAALPLFATGLGGLGMLGWRRKRRAKAVA